jgi:drug/metabolite transporter (DMT)-like permease
LSINDKKLAYSAWIAVCFFWGTGYLAIRVGVENFPPMLFSGLRILSAGVILTGWLVLRGHSLPRGKDWLHLSIVGISLEGISNSVLAWSAQWITSGMMALLVAMTPFWMVGVEALFGEEKITKRIAFGLLVGFGGLFLLVMPQLSGISVDPKFLVGCLLIQVVCISYSAGSVYSKRKSVQVSPLMSAGIQMIIAGGIIVLIGTFWGEWGKLQFNARSLIALIYMLIFGSLVGYTSYIYILQKLPISLVSLHRYINPVVAVILGWAILGERFTIRDAIAVAIIFSGVVLVQTKRKVTI